jgi:ABC-type bacteriocin/lantibiotic exporter with double-glycine peptidase domain
MTPDRNSLSVALLEQLAAIAGVPHDPQRAQVALRNQAAVQADPLAALSAAAAEVCLSVSILRGPLRQLLWHARDGHPLLLWATPAQRWVVVTHYGGFRVRVADGLHPYRRLSLGRSQLQAMLGLESLDHEVEAGWLAPERPMQAAVDEQAGDAAAEHHGLSPQQRLFGLLRMERREVGVLLFYSALSGVLYLAAPLAVDAVVSNLAFGSQSRPFVQALVVLALALLGALGLQALVAAVQYVVAEVIQRRIFVRAAADLAYRLPRVRVQELDEIHAPELVNRFLDVVTVQKSTALLLLDGVNLVVGSLIGMLLLSLYHPALLLFVLVLLLLVLGGLALLGRGAVRSSIAESRLKYDVVNWFESVVTFPNLFKGPGGSLLANERANQLAGGYLSKRAAHFAIVMRQVVALLLLSVLASASLLLLGGWLVISQQITLGQLVASELIMGSIVVAMTKMGKKLEAWYDVLAAMDKLGHLFDLRIEREDGEQPSVVGGAMSLRACDLEFGREGQAPVFSHLNFEIAAGGRAAVIGPHGSGASSLLDMLFGLRQPLSGHLSVGGLDLRSWYLEALRERVMLLRRDEIVEGSVVDNLRLGRPDVGMDEVRHALERVGLLDDLLHRPDGLNLRLKPGGAPLSGNQRTRLLLARAWVQRPQLLLLDEILDGLGSDCFEALCDTVFDPELPWTVVVATREEAVAMRCGQRIVLGRLGTNSSKPDS